MKRVPPHHRGLRFAMYATLTLAVFEGCTSSGDSTALTPTGTVSLTLALDSCGDALLLHLMTQNWKMLPPGLCGNTEQCGSARVTVLDENGRPLAVQYAATSDVSLDLSALVSASTLADAHLIKVELLNDALKPVSTAADANTNATIPVDQSLNDCDSSGGAAGS
jgi:hypothetical protein